MRVSDHYEIADQRIIQYLKEGKTTMEIMYLLNQEEFKTAKGDLFLRKTVNNRITKMREEGMNVPPLNDLKRNPKQLETLKIEERLMKKKVRINLIKPGLYKTEGGKFRVRKLVDKTIVTKTFVTQQEAEEFLDTLLTSKEIPSNDVSSTDQVSITLPKIVKKKPKTEHQLFEIENTPVEEKKYNDSVTIIKVPNVNVAVSLLKELYN